MRNTRAVIPLLSGTAIFAGVDFLHRIRNNDTSAISGQRRGPTGDISAGRVYTRANMSIRLKNIARCAKKVQMFVKLVWNMR